MSPRAARDLDRIATRNLVAGVLVLVLAAAYPAVVLWVLAAALGLACSVTAACSMAIGARRGAR